LFALELEGSPLLQPTLDKSRAAPGVRLVTLQAGVPLGEIIAEQRFLRARLEKNELLPAGHINEQGQKQGKRLFADDRVNTHDHRGNEAGTNRQASCLAETEARPQEALEQPAAVHGEADQNDIQEEENPVDPEEASDWNDPWSSRQLGVHWRIVPMQQ